MGLDPHSNRPRGGPIPDVKRTSQRCPEEVEEMGEMGKAIMSGEGVGARSSWMILHLYSDCL